MTHKDAKVGDLVCLDRFPFKPFKVMAKTRASITLGCETPVQAQRTFTIAEFDAAEYVRLDPPVDSVDNRSSCR